MSRTYDEIAAIYDADMGVNMHLPDIQYYVRTAQSVGGPVLELGCGTGRILAGLHSAGIDAWGVDNSEPMLAQARARLSQNAPLVFMDIRRLNLHNAFTLALLPYSLPTYLTEDDDWYALRSGLQNAMAPGGMVLLDAFIPQPQNQTSGWQHDYARRVGNEWLVRHKRITSLASNFNLVERRYRQQGFFGGATLRTSEVIRTFTPTQLVDQAERFLGPVQRTDYDYGEATGPLDAHFCTVLTELR